MTHTVGGRRRRIARGWLAPLFGTVLLLVATAGGVAAKAILLDFAAWWPVWALLGLLTFLGRDTRWGKIRVSGLVPFVALLALAMFGWGYVKGWALMPSASLQLIGPQAADYQVAALSARLDGNLDVGMTSSEFLYEVRPLRSGGTSAAPEAVERTQGAGFSVALQTVAEPGLYLFSGWDLLLAPDVIWGLVLEGKGIKADLSRLSVSQLNLLGSGEVSIGIPAKTSPITVDGTFRLNMPASGSVRIIGDAQVPAGWSQTSEGWESPAQGEGWVVSVSPGATLVITLH